MECPFCGWVNKAGEYEMLLHIETLHAEGDSQFVVKGADPTPGAVPDEDCQYVECPVEGCAEVLQLPELDYHLELHSEESGDNLDPDQGTEAEAETKTSAFGPSRAHREAERHRRAEPGSDKNDRQANTISAWKRLLKMPGSSSSHSILSSKRSHGEKHGGTGRPSRGRRFGTSMLGQYAHEDRMPDWLVSLLKKSGQTASPPGVVSVLAVLLEQSSSTKYAYVCHPCVQHVSKLKREGGFCGYRNIQSLCSYIIGTESQGHKHFNNTLPSIFQIQDWVETAWDQGINSHGRLETGGIKGTRKFIGTSEAVTMFRLLGIPCGGQSIRNQDPAKSEAQLMEYVENYFQSGVYDATQRVRTTNLPPLYLQNKGHSLTVVGFEKLKDGSSQILVFDPTFHDSSYIIRLIGQTFVHPVPDLALRPYRRGTRYLKAHREFEVLR
ncbi:peptidase family C78-domain-containing protein [Staphylotrichum tortipilum]|uniref:Peptidase family C78-domain-containing protein n=1 Tax=Staphylotrichum tortipilum TaxID=2831512 RepID=A0AAN6RUL4_9PEZI|nr:peptidase family C78-domain-containing protein [Staphylotrichum longicolle]